MNITNHIARIQQKIASSERYEDYVPELEEYKQFLESLLLQNPKDVAAICQLASVYNELRYDYADCISPMEAILNDDLSPADKIRLYTNLAFYHEDWSRSGEEARCYLEAAIALSPNTSHAFDALGRLYLDSDAARSLSLFKKACELENKLDYQYNYAVALYSNGFYEEAKAMFESLLSEHQNDLRVHYGLGVCLYYLGQIEQALKIADTLKIEKVRRDDYIGESQVADLYFLCGEYEKHNCMYDNSRYWPDITWLAPYFYGTKVNGNPEAGERLLSDVIKGIDEDIANIETDDDCPPAEKEEYILSCNKKLSDIIETHAKIMSGGFKPEVKIKLWCIYGCYLIDCVRHQQQI